MVSTAILCLDRTSTVGTREEMATEVEAAPDVTEGVEAAVATEVAGLVLTEVAVATEATAATEAALVGTEGALAACPPNTRARARALATFPETARFTTDICSPLQHLQLNIVRVGEYLLQVQLHKAD